MKGINLFLRNIKQLKIFRYISFKIVPLGKYSLLPACLNLLGTLLERNLWKPFQIFHRILKNISSIVKAPPLHCSFQSTELVNNLRAGHESMGDDPLLSHCSLLRNPWTKATGVLEHFRQGETKCCAFVLEAFPSEHNSKATKDVSVNFCIHCFAFRDELVMDNTLAVKKNLQHYFFFSHIEGTLFAST